MAFYYCLDRSNANLNFVLRSKHRKRQSRRRRLQRSYPTLKSFKCSNWPKKWFGLHPFIAPIVAGRSRERLRFTPLSADHLEWALHLGNIKPFRCALYSHFIVHYYDRLTQGSDERAQSIDELSDQLPPPPPPKTHIEQMERVKFVTCKSDVLEYDYCMPYTSHVVKSLFDA